MSFHDTKKKNKNPTSHECRIFEIIVKKAAPVEAFDFKILGLMPQGEV